MASKRTRVFALGVAIGILSCATARGEPAATAVNGKAYSGEWRPDLASSAAVFTVRVEAERNGGIDRLRSAYTDEKGVPFMEQTVTFRDGAPVEFLLQDRRSDRTGRLTVTPAELVLEWGATGNMKTERVERPPLFAVGPSISRLMRDHAADLALFHPLEFSMVVTQRLDVYQLQLTREPASDNEPIPEVRSGQWMRLTMQPASRMLRMFAPKVTFVVEVKTGRMMLMTGPIPAPEHGGGMLPTGTIVYGQ